MVGCATVLGVFYRGHDVFLCVVIGETAAAGTNNKSRENRITPVHTTRNITDGTVIIIFIIIIFVLVVVLMYTLPFPTAVVRYAMNGNYYPERRGIMGSTYLYLLLWKSGIVTIFIILHSSTISS